jgi:hypothetical protein
MNSVGSFVGRHRALAATAALIAAGLIVFVLVWFQPHKLFLEQRVSEALPGSPVSATETAETTTDATTAPTEPQLVTLAGGPFRSLEHATTGRALILEDAEGNRYLRFEDLETSNGPDLHVYISEVPASDDWYAYGERFVDLGKLKGNIGDQNYEIPDGVDLSKYRSAVIWCKRFAVGFAVAPLDG